MSPLRSFMLTILLVVLVLLPAQVPAQLPGQDSLLSLLRGMWEHRTYRETWSLDFLSDKEVVVDRHSMEYALAPANLHLIDQDRQSDKAYTLDGDRLTLQLPEGGERVYDRARHGFSESFLRGVYYLVLDSGLATEVISFDGRHTFHVHANFPKADPDSEKAKRNGLYRIEENRILLTYQDGVGDEGLISSRSDNGRVLKVEFNGKLYELEWMMNLHPPRLPRPREPRPWPFPPRPCPPLPPPHHPPYPEPIPGPVPPQEKPRPDVPDRSGGERSDQSTPHPGRDFGSTRGERPNGD